MSVGEILTGVSTLAAALIGAIVLIWIFFENKREADRNDRRAARHSELTGSIKHIAKMSEQQHAALEQKIDSQLSVLLDMIKEQGHALRKQGEKIDRFERVASDLHTRLAVLEAKRECASVDQPAGGKGKA